MQHLAVPWHVFYCTHPHIPIQVQGHRHVAIIQYPGGGNLLCRNGQHDIRLAQREGGIAEGQGFEGIRCVIAGRSGIDPVHQGLQFFRRQPCSLLNWTPQMGIQLARRHASGQQHFFHHARPTPHHGMLGHGPGPNTAHMVALDAVLLQDRGNVCRIGRYLPGVGIFGRKVDQAARSFRHVSGQGGPGKMGIQGVPQVPVLGLGLLGFVMKTVINRSPVHHLQGGRIDNESF